jgi:hypothetical protein
MSRKRKKLGRKPNRVQAFPLSPSQAAELEPAARAGDGFEVIGPNDFPTFVPTDLKVQFDSATRIVSGSATGHPTVLYNFRRIDKGSVDEHPFGVLLISGSIAVSSSFLEHGSWANRTTPITSQHAADISGSGIGNYFLSHPVGGLPSGSLAQLSQSDRAAFDQFIGSVFAPGV